MRSVTRRFLDNGIEVITDPFLTVSDVFLSFSAKQGSETEPAHSTGSSHFREHLFFRGVNLAATKDLVNRLDAVGIRTNGATEKEYVNAFFYGPKEHYGLMVQAAFDALHRDFDEHQFQLEKLTIEGELHHLRSGEIEFQLTEQVNFHAYPGSRYATICADDLAVLPFLTAKQVQDQRNILFHPENTAVIAVGDAPARKLMDVVRKTFGTIPVNGPRTIYPYNPPPRVDVKFEVPHHGITTCYAAHLLRAPQMLADAPADEQKETYVHNLAGMMILEKTMGGPDSSLMYSAARLEGGQLYHVWAELFGSRPEMRLMLRYPTLPRFEELNGKMIRSMLEDLAARALPQKQLDAYKRYVAHDFELNMDDGDTKIAWYSDNAANGIFVKPDEFAKHVRNYSATDFRDFVSTLLPGVLTVVFTPGYVPAAGGAPVSFGDFKVQQQPGKIILPSHALAQ